MEDAERDADDGEPLPVRPQSPFVKNLRMQVALSRQPTDQQQLGWEHQPSIGTWLSPRSPRKSSVSFSSDHEVVPISHRESIKVERVLLDLNFKGTCAKPFKLENVDAALTVRNVKELCEAKCSLPPDQQRLLYKGVILQDTKRIQDINIPDKATLFLVKGAAASSSSEPREQQTTSATASDSDDMEDRPSVVAMLCLECGVNPGRLLTDGLCSICFRELVMRENAALKKRKEEAKKKEEDAKRLEEERKREEEELEAQKQQKNTARCYQCGKKTGLTGFQCKCGYFFCSAHRHAEDHACAFDHKAHGRQILAQQNPKVENGSWE